MIDTIARRALLALALTCSVLLAGTPVLAAGHRKPARHTARGHKRKRSKHHRKAKRHHSASTRPSITSPGGARFVPVLGDWEGTISGGYPVSLQLVYEPSLAKRYGGSPYAFEDLSLLIPELNPALPGCPESTPEAQVIDEHLPQPLGAGGAFKFSSSQMNGGLTGAASASLSIGVSYPAGVGFASECDRTLSGTLRPATRHHVDDGAWTMSFPGGESEAFEVKGGGRLATGVGFGPLTNKCGAMPGSLNLFIAPDGTATQSKPEQFTATLTFTAPNTAGGQMSLGAGGECSAVANASLTTPAP